MSNKQKAMLVTDTSATQKKQTAITFIVIISCIFLLILFPVQNNTQLLIALVMFLLIAPLLYTHLVLSPNSPTFGLTWGNIRLGILWTLLSVFATSIIFFVLLKTTPVFDHYFLPTNIRNYFSVFLIYEIGVIGIQILVLEYFLRCFIIGQLQQTMGLWSIVVQVIALALLSQAFFAWIPLMIATPFAGITAYYSRSIYYSLFITMYTVLLVDVMIIATT